MTRAHEIYDDAEIEKYVAKNKLDQNDLLELRRWIEDDLMVLNVWLQQVRIKLSHEIISADSPHARSPEFLPLRKQVYAVLALTETVQHYLKTIECATACCFAYNKMSEKDIGILKTHQESLQHLRDTLLTQVPLSELKSKRDAVVSLSLSQQIYATTQSEYNISYKRIWLRRLQTVLAGAAGYALGLGLTLLLITPGANVLAALTAIPFMIFAGLAFFNLHAPVLTTWTAYFGGDAMDVGVALPSTLGLPAAGFYSGWKAIKKCNFTNPPREAAAKTAQVATIQCLVNQLQEKINKLDDATYGNKLSNVKIFLLDVVVNASRLYNAGARGWFYETQQSRMQKGRLILEKVAGILERDVVPNTVQGVLSCKINRGFREGEVAYTLLDLLNSQRNKSTFWQSYSATYKLLKEHSDVSVEPATSLSFQKIAVAA